MASNADRILLLDQPEVGRGRKARPEGRWRSWARRARRIGAVAREIQDRLLHAPRRILARRALGRGGIPNSVLIVCYGNICRSPYAAATLARRLPSGLGVRVDSAGFIGPDRSPPPEALAVGAARGIPLERHRSKVLTAELVRSAEVIVVMDPAQSRWLRHRFGRRDAVVLGDLDPRPIRTRTITDPVMKTEPVFAEVYERIDRCMEGLLHAVLRADAL